MKCMAVNLDGFVQDTHKNVFLSESQMDKKWNPYIFEYTWSTYYSAQCMCFASPSDILFSVVQHTKSYSYPNRKQLNCQKLYCREKTVDWLPFQYLLFLSEFCDSSLTFWPPTKTFISRSSESYTSNHSLMYPSPSLSLSVCPSLSLQMEVEMNLN